MNWVDIATVAVTLFAALQGWDMLRSYLARRKQVRFIQEALQNWICEARRKDRSARFAAEVLLEICERALRFGPGHLTWKEAYKLALGASYLKRRLDEAEKAELSHLTRVREDGEEFHRQVVEQFVGIVGFLRL